MLFYVLMRRNHRAMWRERVFRGCTHPLEVYNHEAVYRKFRFHKQFIFELAELRGDLKFALPRRGSRFALLWGILQLGLFKP